MKGTRLRARARWVFGRMTAGLRLLPDFVVIGAQKAGTTSLFSYLCEHPLVRPGLAKEVHFFDNNFARGPGWYRAHFPQAPRQDRRIGEATPYYMFHPLAPARMAATIPDAKLIVVLRNPVDRAYSHYHHEVRGGTETHSFEEALTLEAQRLDGEAERMREDPNFHSAAHQQYSYVSRGIYVDQLRTWHELFPKEQVLVLGAERLFKEPSRVICRVFEFLGLPYASSMEFRTWNGARNPKLDPRTRAQLVERFAPHNQRLYEYLGVDFGWDS